MDGSSPLTATCAAGTLAPGATISAYRATPAGDEGEPTVQFVAVRVACHQRGPRRNWLPGRRAGYGGRDIRGGPRGVGGEAFAMQGVELHTDKVSVMAKLYDC